MLKLTPEGIANLRNWLLEHLSDMPRHALMAEPERVLSYVSDIESATRMGERPQLELRPFRTVSGQPDIYYVPEGDVLPIAELSRRGDGDKELVLWRRADGLEVIETNGSMVYELEDGFEDLRAYVCFDTDTFPIV